MGRAEEDGRPGGAARRADRIRAGRRRLLQLSQDQAVKDALLANTSASVERGTFGSPTFFVGDEIFFGKDRLRDVEAAISAGR